jgi:hypothetical protein
MTGPRNYDVTADGRRFLVLKDVSRDAEAAFPVVVENWFEELKRLLPAKHN